MKLYLIYILLFIVVLTNGNGFAQAITTGNQIVFQGTTYAFIVGVSHYPYIQPPLDYADMDAELFQYYLQSPNGGNAHKENIKILLNDSASQGNIITAMRGWMMTRPYQKGDRLFVYLAGHGDAIDSVDGEFYFLSYNCTLGNDGAKNNYMAGGAIQINNLQNRLKKIAEKGVQIILIMDACRSNEIFSLQKNVFEPVDESAITMLSAQPGKTSMESITYGGGHGLFTWYLIDGLMGCAANGKPALSLLDLEYYVSLKVKQINNDQEPAFLTHKSRMEPLFWIDPVLVGEWVKSASNFCVAPRLIPASRQSLQLTFPDSFFQKLYNGFSEALNENNISYAQSLLEEINQKYPNNTQTINVNEQLIAAYLNYAQGKINTYLEGKDFSRMGTNLKDISKLSAWEKKQYFIQKLTFQDAAGMMYKALALLKDSVSYQFDKSLWAKYYFLQAASSIHERLYGPAPLLLDSALAIKGLISGLDFCNKAIELQPKAAYLYNCRGLLQIKKDPGKARADFLKAIELNPKWTYPYNALAVIYINQHQNDSAEYYLLKALSFDQKFETGYYNLGTIYFRQDRFSDAEKSYKMALVSYSGFADAAYSLGLLYLDSATMSSSINMAIADSSIYYFTKALELNPNAQVFTSLERLYELKGMKKEADSCAERADTYFYWNVRENSSLTEKEIKDGLNFYKSRLQKGGMTKAYDYYSLGLLYEIGKQSDSVVTYLKLSIKADSSFIDAYRELGDYLLKQNNKNDLKSILSYYLAAYRQMKRDLEKEIDKATDKKEILLEIEEGEDFYDCIQMDIADIYSRLGKIDKSLYYIKKAIKCDCFDEEKAIKTQRSFLFKLICRKALRARKESARSSTRCPVYF